MIIERESILFNWQRNSN
jgi:hypothetical protein